MRLYCVVRFQHKHEVTEIYSKTQVFYLAIYMACKLDSANAKFFIPFGIRVVK